MPVSPVGQNLQEIQPRQQEPQSQSTDNKISDFIKSKFIFILNKLGDLLRGVKEFFLGPEIPDPSPRAEQNIQNTSEKNIQNTLVSDLADAKKASTKEEEFTTSDRSFRQRMDGDKKYKTRWNQSTGKFKEVDRSIWSTKGKKLKMTEKGYKTGQAIRKANDAILALHRQNEDLVAKLESGIQKAKDRPKYKPGEQPITPQRKGTGFFA